ncbi:hypothetical protein CK203_114408 [Vitis vinifera]|uniref:Uncharacterized protein n=1 Tax=Vitis vinifera TaxID=29760 RepID=A0A438C4U6_VITVI|nr:hypothetical protein CK203_114408 [Vitis vinifera]
MEGVHGHIEIDIWKLIWPDGAFLGGHVSIPDWLSWNQNSVFESQSEIATWQGGICKSCRLLRGAEERVLLGCQLHGSGNGTWGCRRVRSLGGGELLFGFFGEVPGGWLQKEEKEESFREETRGRRLLRGDFEATGERVREIHALTAFLAFILETVDASPILNWDSAAIPFTLLIELISSNQPEMMVLDVVEWWENNGNAWELWPAWYRKIDNWILGKTGNECKAKTGFQARTPSVSVSPQSDNNFTSRSFGAKSYVCHAVTSVEMNALSPSVTHEHPCGKAQLARGWKGFIIVPSVLFVAFQLSFEDHYKMILQPWRPPLGPSPAGFHSCSRGRGVSCSICGSRLECHENEGESAAASTDQIESPHEENAREKRKSSSSKTDAPLLLDLQVEEIKYVFEVKTFQRRELLVLSTLQWKNLQACKCLSCFSRILLLANRESRFQHANFQASKAVDYGATVRAAILSGDNNYSSPSATIPDNGRYY